MRSGFGAGRGFAVLGLYSTIGVMLLDFVASNGLPLPSGAVIGVVLLAGTANITSALATQHRDSSSARRRALILVAIVAAHGATRDLAGPRPFDGDSTTWIVAHVLLVTTILAAGNLRTGDLYRALLVTALLSLGTLVLGDLALSTDARSIPGMSGRLKGIYGHPNITAMAAATLLVLAARDARARRLGIAVAIGTLALTVSITGSVTALVALWALRRGESRPWRSAATSVLAVAAVTPVLIAVGRIHGVAPEMFTGRVQIWTWAIDQPMDRFNGVGSAIFAELRGSFFPISWYHAHNQLIMDLLTGGYILAFVTVALTVAIRLTARGPLAFALWVVLAVGSITEVPLTIDYPGARVVILSMIISGILADLNDRSSEVWT